MYVALELGITVLCFIRYIGNVQRKGLLVLVRVLVWVRYTRTRVQGSVLTKKKVNRLIKPCVI